MKSLITIVMALTIATVAVYGEATEAPPAPAEEQPEVLTRGPVHEAFAEPVNLQDEKALLAPVAPPANIEEILPDERPVGEQYVWVPGYWAWDGERNSYIWVSGCWRAAPQNMYWVPGYWNKVAVGWEWVPGFWTPVSSMEIEYLPAPPALVDVEAPGPPPYEDRIWVPPCWYWYQGQYILRRGYWVAAQADWLWVPSHYIRTPRGHVFAAGHWDYTFGRRGVLFAPVYFPRHIYERPRYSFSLSIVIDTGAFEFGLFTCPRYSHYYFGDYYDDLYIGIGIFPRYECERRHTWYDPVYVHDRWRNRGSHPNWEDFERQEYDRRRRDRDLRPPRTYRELEARVAKLPESRRRDVQIAETMTAAVSKKTTTMKFERIKTDDRKRILTQSDDVRKFGKERSRWESESRVPRVTGSPAAGPKEATSRGQGGQRTESAAPKAGETPPKGGDRGLRTEDSGQKTQDKGQVSRFEVEPDRVKVPSPPIVGRQGGIFRKGPPSRPADEQKTEVKETSRQKESQKSEEPRGGKDSRRGGEQRRNK